jgi:DNA primase
MSWKAQIDRILKQAEPKLEKESTQIFLPIKEAMFDKPYRGISAETFEKIGAYHTFKDSYYGRRIIIPIYNYRNELKSFEAISTSSKIQPKALRPKNVLTADLFGFEHLLGESDTLFLTEGTFSALSFWELGYQGVFNMGVATIKDKIKTLHIKGIKNILLVGDNDPSGKSFNKECYHLLKHNFNVTFFQFPYTSPEKYDSNDLLKQGREILQECIDKSLIKGLIKIKYNKIQEID